MKRRLDRGFVRTAMVNALIVWSAIFGSISLLTFVLFATAFLQGPQNSGVVPQTVSEVLIWTAFLAPYANVLARPFTAAIAAVVGSAVAWVMIRRPQRPLHVLAVT